VGLPRPLRGLFLFDEHQGETRNQSQEDLEFLKNLGLKIDAAPFVSLVKADVTLHGVSTGKIANHLDPLHQEGLYIEIIASRLSAQTCNSNVRARRRQSQERIRSRKRREGQMVQSHYKDEIGRTRA
jgi:hypothetical protein